MNAFVVTLLMAVAMAEDTLSANLADDEPAKVGILVNNARLWGLLIFLFLVLKVAWKINTDNAPDFQKDSILYAKFLTNKVEKSKME